MKKILGIVSTAALCMCALAGGYETKFPERYVQCYNGEIQILPALPKDEIPSGHVENVPAVGGFVFDLDWRENKMTRMRVYSKNGGVCRIRSYAGMGSPILRKAMKDCPNPAIAATKNRRRGPNTPESCFDRAKNPLQSVCYDFDTSKGEMLEFLGVSGNQDWTTYSANISENMLRSPEGARIVRNVLDWQLDTGGWPKNVPMHERLTERERAAVLAFKADKKRGTIDNLATFSEMRFLARYYKANQGQLANAAATSNDQTIKRSNHQTTKPSNHQTTKPSNHQTVLDALQGVERGVDFLLYMQYPNGGWPQCDPSKVGYWHQITYNDGAMINVMNTLRDIYEMRPPFDIPIPEAKRQECRKAFLKGLGCILKTQYVQNGEFTVWCQQHDRDTLKPCIGRAFELPSLCTLESADIVRFLMSLKLDEYPAATSKRIREGIEGAMQWFAKTAMLGYKIEDNYRRDDGILSRRLVRIPEDESKPMWCRYYTLEDNRPFTGTRQSEMKFTFEEMERGENMSYQWFNTTGTQLKSDYEKWLSRQGQDGAGKAVPAAKGKKGGDAVEKVWKGGKGSGGEPYIEPKKDTWENVENWQGGRPGVDQTAVFAKKAEIWTVRRDGYECGRIVLKGGAKVALRSHEEVNSVIRPYIHTSAIEGKGTLILGNTGIEAREGETLVIPPTVSIIADSKEGSGSFLSARPGGKLIVKGSVTCSGHKLQIGDGVTLEGKVEGFDKFDVAAGAVILHKPAPAPQTFYVGANPLRRLKAGERVFATIQEAFNAIPQGTEAHYTIRVAPGRYREKVRFSGNRSHVTLVAENPDPAKTVISWNDTPATLNERGKPMGTFGCYTLYVDIADFEMTGFTIENTGTPERLAKTGGKEQAGQCVALFATGDREIFKKCRILGWQDTIYAGGKVGFSPVRQLFDECYIEGAVDFIFGDALAVFNKCHLHLVANGYVTAGSHDYDMPFGYVFVKCSITAAPTVNKAYLGRPWRPFANVTWVECDFGDAIQPEGWRDWTEACGQRVWRAYEYDCTQKGQRKRDPIVKIGKVDDFRERLAAAGYDSVSQIFTN